MYWTKCVVSRKPRKLSLRNPRGFSKVSYLNLSYCRNYSLWYCSQAMDLEIDSRMLLARSGSGKILLDDYKILV